MDDNLEALRRRAFSRVGTADDRRRLAEAEAHATATLAPERPDADENLDAPTDAPAPGEFGLPVETAPPSSRTETIRTALLGAAAGAVATVLVMTVAGAIAAGRITHVAATNDISPDPLTIFDTPATTEDAIPGVDLRFLAPGGLAGAESRYLASTPQGTMYAVRGTGSSGPTVCLALAFTTGTSASCALVSDFAASGILYVDSQLTARWGPVGSRLWLPAD